MVWMEFWRISPGEYDYMENLWGPEGKTTITGHLESIRRLTKRCAELQRQYSSELSQFKNKRKFKFLKKFLFAFSGKKEFESINESIRLQLYALQSDAKAMFLERHPSFKPGDLSKTAVKNTIQEIQEIENVRNVRRASSTILKTLSIPTIAEMELKLRRCFIGKETFTLATSKALMEDTVKFPLSLTVKEPHGDGPKPNDDLSPNLHTVVEFDDKTVHSSVEMSIGEASAIEYQAITHLFQASLSQAPHGDSIRAIYRLSPELGTPKLIFHTMFADKGEEFSHRCMQVPKRPLAHFFEELETLGGIDAFQKFPIRDRLELAYLLAVTVMNLHETGWLTKLCSHHVTWGKEHYEGKKYCSLKVLGQDICENGDLSTPFDIFKNSALDVSANVFSLGLLLHEVGTGQLIQRKAPVEQLARQPAWHADSLLLQTGNIISNTYATVVETCLRGTFDISTHEHFLRSYFARVIQPLRELNSIHKQPTPLLVQSSHSKLSWGTISLEERFNATDMTHLSQVELTHAYESSRALVEAERSLRQPDHIGEIASPVLQYKMHPGSLLYEQASIPVQLSIQARSVAMGM
ncbi:hypothetical protein BGX38DRAFT_1164416 [Terfezia claveryi]|nr:hypothetical protein BGX38DRAFT_1164416 [Terfezia claveryi]